MIEKKSPSLKLAFIGMSGIGKSFWGTKLRDEAGFNWICCDDEIQKILKTRYPLSGVEEVNGVATWMKNPWEAGHKESEREYLELEEQVTSAAIAAAESNGAPIVIDTTGSVIYLAPSTIKRLAASCTTVLFDHSPTQAELLYETFLKHPKPLIWGESYSQREGESHETAMARSFRELLAFRESQYRALGKRIIPMEKHRNHGLSSSDFLALIQER